MVKATDFKFEVHRQSGHDPLKIFRKGGVCKNSLGGDIHSRERLLVALCYCVVLFSSSSSAQQQQSAAAGRDPRAAAANDPRLRTSKVNDQPPETSLSPPASPPQTDTTSPVDLEVNGLSREVLYVLRRITISSSRPLSIPAHVTADELKQRNDPRLLHYRSTIHSGMLKPPPTSSATPEQLVPHKPQNSPPPFTLPDIVLPPIGMPLPPMTKPNSMPSPGFDQKLAIFSPEKPASTTPIKMPEALQEQVLTRSEVPERRPSGGFEPSSSDKKVIDYRNDPRYKKKKTRSISKDDDGFLPPKSRSDNSSTVGYVQEDFEIEYMRSGSHGELPSLSAGFADRVGKSRVLEPEVVRCSGGRSSDSDGQVSPPARYGTASQQLPSFLLPNSELAEEESPNEEVSLKDMFKTIDPTTSPFC